MNDTLPMGTIVELKVPCMGNDAGTRGICYEVYLLDEFGSSFIFENGEYCGFSIEEQKDFLKVIKQVTFTYKFTNVMQLSADFKVGVFDVMKS